MTKTKVKQYDKDKHDAPSFPLQRVVTADKPLATNNLSRSSLLPLLSSRILQLASLFLTKIIHVMHGSNMHASTMCQTEIRARRTYKFFVSCSSQIFQYVFQFDFYYVFKFDFEIYQNSKGRVPKKQWEIYGQTDQKV